VHASHTRLYESIIEPPLLGKARAIQSTTTYALEVPVPLVGEAIAVGIVITEAPTVLVDETDPKPSMLEADTLTCTRVP
jgi:hypothetical protein